MLEQNYTNASDKGRFGFSESGAYRAPFKAEATMITVFTLIFILGTAAGVVGAVLFLRQMMKDSPAATLPLLYAIAAALMILLAFAVSFLVFRMGVAYTRKGFACKFDANDEKFVATIGGTVHSIYYNEVQSITFTPKSIFKKIHGYDVDIVIGNSTERYGVAFEGKFQSEKTTPFYIIKERLDIIERRKSDEAARLAEKKHGTNDPISQADVEAARQNKKTLEDRARELISAEQPPEAVFAEPSEMKAINPSTMPKAAPAGNTEHHNSPDEFFEREEMPQIGGKKNKS